MVMLEGGNLQSPEFRADLVKLALRNAMSLVVGDVIKAVEKMEWQGLVAKVHGSKVYVNAGQKSGIVLGDILKVITPGHHIYDPETGAYLGESKGELKGTLEVVDFVGEDGASATVHTGGHIKEGDIVHLY